MSQSKFIGRLLSWVIAVAALGFFYAGEALAACCKSKSTGACSCSLLACNTLTHTTVSSCTQSAGSLTLNSSVISCIANEAVGTVSAFRGSEATGEPAVWTEAGLGVTCTKDGDLNSSARFDLLLEYTMKGGCIDDPNAGLGQCKFSDSDNKGRRGGGGTTSVSQAVCNPATGVLTYKASCGPDVKVKGTLRYIGENMPPAWVDGPGPVWQLVLGGFRTDKKGNVLQSACEFDFRDQSGDGGLGLKEVLFYTETYTNKADCTGPRVDASDAKRRMCHDHTFNNPDYDPITGLGAANPPCDPTNTSGQLVTFTGGIDPNDRADLRGALLFENQWRPNSTLNLGCSNSGNIPTTLVNSENFAASSFPPPSEPTPPGTTIVAYVKGIDTDTSPATGATPIFDASGNPTGLRITFDECRPNGDGLNQVLCRHQDQVLAGGYINLTIEGDKPSGLGFIGDAIQVKLSGSCPQQ